jgi:hypothetical protein
MSYILKQEQDFVDTLYIKTLAVSIIVDQNYFYTVSSFELYRQKFYKYFYFPQHTRPILPADILGKEYKLRTWFNFLQHCHLKYLRPEFF